MSTLIELNPNRDLLDANFDGYKLSLESVPIYKSSLKTGVDHILPSDDQYSFLHVRAFGLHNHLYGDPWLTDNLYYIDCNWHIQKNIFSTNSRHFDDWVEVWQVPSHHERKPGHYNTSLDFTCPDMAVVSDGAGTLYLLDTGRRVESGPWKVLFSGEVCGKENAFIVIDSQVTVVDQKRTVHCLLEHIDEIKVDNAVQKVKVDHFKTILEWITLTEEENQKWSLLSVRKLSGAGGVDYAAFERGCRCVYVASNRKFDFIIDSEKPVEMKCPLEPDEAKKCFSWMQTGEDITVWVPMPDEGITMENLTVTVEDDLLRVVCQDKVLLDGPTWQCLDAKLATWSLDKCNLELKLIKNEQGVHWPEVLKGDVDAEEIVMDPTLREQADNQLAQYTSEIEVTDTELGCSPGFNADQLEDCDSLPDMLQLMRLDTHSHAVTHQINLGGHQWLFNTQLNPDEAPAMCLRYDVDGCVWQVTPPTGDSGDWPCTHVGTFLAFGYVQASKIQKKFTVCAPDLSFVAICDASRHIYLYHQPSQVNGELRNRKSGRNVAEVAKQHVINLDSASEVLEIHSTNNDIYVLTTDTIYALQVNF